MKLVIVYHQGLVGVDRGLLRKEQGGGLREGENQVLHYLHI
jgi:hypothetical protein